MAHGGEPTPSAPPYAPGYPVAGPVGARGTYATAPPPPLHYQHAGHAQPQPQNQPRRTEEKIMRAAGMAGAAVGSALVGAARGAIAATTQHAQTRGSGSANTRRAQPQAPAVVQMMTAPMAPAVQQMAQVYGVHSQGQGLVPTTCWCGFEDDPEMSPCVRGTAKVVLFPAAVAAWPLGAVLWAALQTHFCLFSCCMMHHVTRLQSPHQLGQLPGMPGAPAHQRDTVDCWECQAKAWVACDKCNGRCWVCELPTTKRVLKGHVVEAPCQLCLWGTTR